MVAATSHAKAQQSTLLPLQFLRLAHLMASAKVRMRRLPSSEGHRGQAVDHARAGLVGRLRCAGCVCRDKLPRVALDVSGHLVLTHLGGPHRQVHASSTDLVPPPAIHDGTLGSTLVQQ